MNAQNAAQKPNKKPKTAITPTREEDFPGWYQAVIKAGDLAENAPVRGCMIMKPYGYAIWENIQASLGGMIKDQGVDNAYFPLLIPLSYIAKEADHIDGFATECAVVTHHRLEKNAEGKLAPAPSSELTEPYVIRPTSETIIGETLSNWVQSYRDLPMKLNQWCNVMRWEMRPRIFLRTSEFLWQEGHNCFETAEEAAEDTAKMLEVYATFLEDTLAIPVIRGEKTADERFPGAISTLTVEAMMQDGKALQSGTSHNLGQTFSKSALIKFQGRDSEEHFAWTTSWGVSTRTIGGLIMTHADDDGLIMPPRVAPYQVIIIPVVKGDNEDAVNAYARELQNSIKQAGFSVKLDDREERSSNKMWDAIKKGVPVRVEVGGNEMEAGELTSVRRDIGRESKTTESIGDFIERLPTMLDDIHNNMYKRAKDFLDSHIFEVKTLDEVATFFKEERTGFVKMDVALLDDPRFEELKKAFAITPRCIPFADNGKKVVVGKSY
jgi:prolyl-tRNA synthetase